MTVLGAEGYSTSATTTHSGSVTMPEGCNTILLFVAVRADANTGLVTDVTVDGASATFLSTASRVASNYPQELEVLVIDSSAMLAGSLPVVATVQFSSTRYVGVMAVFLTETAAELGSVFRTGSSVVSETVEESSNTGRVITAVATVPMNPVTSVGAEAIGHIEYSTLLSLDVFYHKGPDAVEFDYETTSDTRIIRDVLISGLTTFQRWPRGGMVYTPYV